MNQAQTIRLDDLPDVLYVKEMAQLLRTSEKAVRRKIDRGHIRAVKIGGRILVTRNEVLRLLGLDQPKRTTATVHNLPAWRERSAVRRRRA